MIDVVDFAKALIRCPSITPLDAGALDILENALSGLGFKCVKLPFSAPGQADIDNLYARIGTGSPHFCYAGHTDVVPVGDADSWRFAPFDGHVDNGILYGRGSSDMKGGIAAFVAAVSTFIDNNKNFDGSISFLITGDEEGPAINGTVKMLKWLEENDEIADVCLVGEPTNIHEIGDMAKIGRRGSLNGCLSVFGVQGHVAYPDLADNPIPRLIEMLNKLTQLKFDQGNEFFQPSNLEIVSVDVDNDATNVIPGGGSAKFNIRFNSEQNFDGLKKILIGICDEVGGDYKLDLNLSGDAFLTPRGDLSDLISRAVKKITDKDVELSTSGGTSDARFIKNYCPVIEFGLINKTIHKIDECAAVDDMIILTNIYIDILEQFFDHGR